MKYSQRIEQLPPYLFAEIDRKKKAAIERGVDVIFTRGGRPGSSHAAHIVKAGQAAMAKASNHQYPFGAGLMAFRKAIAAWMEKTFWREARSSVGDLLRHRVQGRAGASAAGVHRSRTSGAGARSGVSGL